MNKELTALQMLIEEIEDMKSVASLEQRKYAFQQVLDWLKVGLVVEQDQIEQAFSEGYQDALLEEGCHASRYNSASGIDYYKSKYGGEK